MKALIVDDLVVRYADFVAVRGAGFGVEAGEIFGLLGPNGAGKTSILGLVDGEGDQLEDVVRCRWSHDVRARSSSRSTGRGGRGGG